MFGRALPVFALYFRYILFLNKESCSFITNISLFLWSGGAAVVNDHTNATMYLIFNIFLSKNSL